MADQAMIADEVKGYHKLNNTSVENGQPGVGKVSGIGLSAGQIDAYMEKLEASGCTPATLKIYRRNLDRFYQFLGENKYIRAGTLTAWQKDLLESGYSARTVNVCLSAANGLMNDLGFPGFQAKRLEEETSIQPELTRAEYLRLLSAAKSQGKRKHYLLVKLFATTGISVSEVKYVTAEAVREGKIRLTSETQRIFDRLQAELRHYMEEEGVTSGPVFVTRAGKPLDRTAINNMIKTLCRDAQVPEEKANPRCLRRLYQATQEGIRENFSLLVAQAHDRLLEKEQKAIGWDS